MSSTAIDALSQSYLRPDTQLQGLAAQTDIATFRLEMRNKAGISLETAITAATLSRTISGASTLTVSVEDDLARSIQRSGRLGRKVDVELDGLFFTLVGVTKTGRNLDLKFEEREVNVLRYYAKYLQVSRAQLTRAEFVLMMLREVHEISLRYVIPELKKRQTISDVDPGQILVDANGNPLVKKVTPDPTTRPQGISAPSAGVSAGKNWLGIGSLGLTVRGQPSTVEQLNNASIILDTGVSLGASRKVLVCSIMTAIDESNIINLTGGDRDSVGIFQQRASQGWPATRNIPTDAKAFFVAAMKVARDNPFLNYNDVCQDTQHSGTPLAYGAFQDEAEKFVDAYGITGGDIASDPSAGNNQKTGALTTLAEPGAGYFFTRGTVSTDTSGQVVLQPEGSWQCITRLAAEVGWRAFCVSGAIYFISDADLFLSKPFMVISEDDEGIDWIDYDYDEGKRQSVVTITAHLARWSAPPGSTVIVRDMGIPNGKHLVSQIDRSLYDTVATITLIKPQPVLPEPTSGPTGVASGAVAMPAGASNVDTDPTGAFNPFTATGRAQIAILAYANSQLGVPYAWGHEDKGIAFDCSGLSQAAYEAGGITLPRTSQQQWALGPQILPPQTLLPADLVFFAGTDGSATAPGHVGIYIGGGQFIDAPFTGQVVRVDTLDLNGTGPNQYVGATRSWETPSG